MDGSCYGNMSECQVAIVSLTGWKISAGKLVWCYFQPPWSQNVCESQKRLDGKGAQDCLALITGFSEYEGISIEVNNSRRLENTFLITCLHCFTFSLLFVRTRGREKWRCHTRKGDHRSGEIQKTVYLFFGLDGFLGKPQWPNFPSP